MAPLVDITAQDVADMLAEAGARRKPKLDELTALVQFIQDIPSLVEDRLWLAEQLRKGNIYERAQQAADDLRRYAMKIAEDEKEIGRFVDDAESIANAEDLANWAAAIPNFIQRPGAPKFRQIYHDPAFFSSSKMWQGQASYLFELYQGVAGPCGLTRDGPAVRFIKRVFERCGVHKHTTPNSIEKAVRGLRDRIDADGNT